MLVTLPMKYAIEGRMRPARTEETDPTIISKLSEWELYQRKLWKRILSIRLTGYCFSLLRIPVLNILKLYFLLIKYPETSFTIFNFKSSPSDYFLSWGFGVLGVSICSSANGRSGPTARSPRRRNSCTTRKRGAARRFLRSCPAVASCRGLRSGARCCLPACGRIPIPRSRTP